MDDRRRNPKADNRIPIKPESVTFQLLDCVALARSLPEFELVEGDVGTIVEVYKEGQAFEVEFNTEEGFLAALLTMAPNDLRAPTPQELQNQRALKATEYMGSTV
jgi:Domain of unknown function (DUF4926)